MNNKKHQNPLTSQPSYQNKILTNSTPQKNEINHHHKHTTGSNLYNQNSEPILIKLLNQKKQRNIMTDLSKWKAWKIVLWEWPWESKTRIPFQRNKKRIVTFRVCKCAPPSFSRFWPILGSKIQPNLFIVVFRIIVNRRRRVVKPELLNQECSLRRRSSSNPWHWQLMGVWWSY